MAKVINITIKHIPDYDMDLSHLGEFSNEKGEFAIEHDQGNSRTLDWFNADNVEDMKQAKQNYDYMMKHEDGELYGIGIKAFATIETGADIHEDWKLQNTITSGGVWGIEMGYDGDDKDIKGFEDGELSELMGVLDELGLDYKNVKPIIDPII
jgi:hypothetical protein